MRALIINWRFALRLTLLSASWCIEDELRNNQIRIRSFSFFFFRILQALALNTLNYRLYK